MQPLLEFLRPYAKGYAPKLASIAFERGLAVTRSDGQRTPIPVTATPVIAEPGQIERACALSARIAAAGLKMARSILAGPARELLLCSLGPLERRVVESSYQGLSRLAITRVDYFISGTPRALELNATIPAMPAYSDIAAAAFIEAVGAYAGLGSDRISALKAENGSNARALYDALLMGFAGERGGAPRRIALLVRRNDPQSTEIEYLRARFEEWGSEAAIVYPDQLSGDRAFLADGTPYDLVYRHLFVRRLEEIRSPYLEDLFSHQPNPKACVLNPPAAHLETKTTFALLSQAAVEPDLAKGAGLSDEELEAIRSAVPWTRALRRYPGTAPDGVRTADLAALVAADPDRYVLKRAWEYGGKAVFVGRSRHEPSFQERVRAAYGAPLEWGELVARAAEDLVGGGFVAQEVINPDLQQHLLWDGQEVSEVPLYVDFSAYASVGLGRQPAWGAVCRGSPSQIVNIVGGGGVLPLIRRGVFDELEAALRSRASNPRPGRL